MKFISDYRFDEIQSVLDEKTEKYSFYNLYKAGTMLSECKGRKIVLWRTKENDAVRATKLTNAFYGKIREIDGRTVIHGHFRLSNMDVISWIGIFALLMLTVFFASQGAIAIRFYNTAIMSVLWCVLCGVIVVIEAFEEADQKKAVVKFIEENLLSKTE